MDHIEVVEGGKTSHHYRLVSGEEGSEAVDLAPVDQIIQDRILEAHNELEAGQRLVVLFAEVHSEPATIMPQISCVRNLANLINPENSEDIVPLIVGLEASHLDAAIRCLDSIDKYSNISNADFLDIYMAQEPTQTINTFGLVRSRDNAMARHSRLMFINACSAHGIPTLGCDAFDDGHNLIAYDQLSVDMAWEHFNIHLGEKPLSASVSYDDDPTGFQVRNYVMAERIINYMQEWDAPIMVIPTGLAHIYGDPSRGYPHETSLVKLLEGRGFKTLVVNLISPNREEDFSEIVAQETLAQHPGHLIVEGICGAKFMDNVAALDIYEEPVAELARYGVFDQEAEQDFIYNLLVPAYSGEDCPFNFDLTLPEIDDLKDVFQAFYAEALESLDEEQREAYFVDSKAC